MPASEFALCMVGLVALAAWRATVSQMSRVKAQRARENSAYVRKLLTQRQPEFAAALDRAEQYFSCVLPGAATGSGNDNGQPGPHVDVETGWQY